MPRAFVVHWDEASVASKAATVEATGHEVVGSEGLDAARALRLVRDLRPDVLVVWTTWLPSHGRALAAAIRSQDWSAGLPCLFVEGDPDPLPKARRDHLLQAVPDALLVTPATLGTWLGKVEAALAHRAAPSQA